MEKPKDTLPSMQAVQPKPTFTPQEMMLAIQIRQWLKVFSKQDIIRIISLVRDDNL